MRPNFFKNADVWKEPINMLPLSPAGQPFASARPNCENLASPRGEGCRRAASFRPQWSFLYDVSACPTDNWPPQAG